MAQATTNTIRKWATGIIAIVLVVCVMVWFVRRDRLPSTIRIATGHKEGLYCLFGNAIKDVLAAKLNRRVAVDTTEGSVDNLRRLLSGEADLAVVQGGSVSLDGVAVVTPLFPELVLVIVRKNSGILEIADLAGHNVSLGREGSGIRKSALRLLEHFGINVADVGHNDMRFQHLLDDDSPLDAAIVTAGIGHRDLADMLRTNKLELLPIADAKAIEMLDPFPHATEVPRGLFAEYPPVPANTIPTISTTAYLVARIDAPDSLVNAALTAVHEGSLGQVIPTLIPRREAAAHVPARFHSVAQRYFNPADNIGYMANVMESLAATKELLFAFGAGVYLLWLRWRRLKSREMETAFRRQKEQLDALLVQTLRIEEAQMRTTDTAQLRTLLDNVTRIKLRALHELTEEELRGDRTFSIFLTQCANLINKIQLKIITYGGLPPVE